MAFQLSPGINVSEVDLTNSTPAVGTTEGAIAGVFRWGPENEKVLITSEQQLVDRFGAPHTAYVDLSSNENTWTNHETFYTASNFLGYSDALYVTRVASSGAAVGSSAAGNFTSKYKGLLANSLSVSWCDSSSFAAAGIGSVVATIAGSSTTVTFKGATADSQITGMKKGDRIIVSGQELVLAGDASITGAANFASAITFNAGEVLSAVDDADGGVIVHNNSSAATILASSIIGLPVGNSAVVAKGQPVRYDQTTHGAVPGLVDGTVYFAIPVVPITGATTTSATHCFKLAATYADAIAHTDAVPKHILLDGTLPAASADNTFEFSTNITGSATVTTKFTGLSVTEVAFTKQWGDANLFDAAPSANSYHVVVKDEDGDITGTAGSILERYEDVSKTSTAKKSDGTTNFLPDVLVASSNWLAITATNANNLSGANSGSTFTSGADGDDEAAIAVASLATGYDLYKDASDVDISFVLQGKARGTTLANYIIDNVAEVRRDCVAFVSPELTDTTVADIVQFSSTLTASSYAVVDSGYKYQYDKYSDVYRYVPLNGDIAGLCARTDDLRDPWFSPAGYNRGNVKNVVKLLVNPNKAERDLLYKNGINPVITQPGQGTVLFGDKTFAPKASAFDRINVRRLFIVLEKTIGQAAKSTLFEFNDEFTRATFVNLVEPFLRDVQGRRGIFDFKVICDATNNTSGVIDANQFVGDIYIKPARSINFIQLNFVAVRSGVEFSEIVGAA